MTHSDIRPCGHPAISRALGAAPSPVPISVLARSPQKVGLSYTVCSVSDNGPWLPLRKKLQNST